MKTALILSSFILFCSPFSWSKTNYIFSGCRLIGSPCEELGYFSNIFIGTVTNKEQLHDKIIYTISVEEVFKGNLQSTIQIISYPSNGIFPGGYVFEAGKQYLVYGGIGDRVLECPRCSRTQLLSQAEEDLNFLRSLSAEGAGGRLFGHISDQTDDNILPFKLTIEGDGKIFGLLTDDKGFYEISGLKEGKYSIRIIVSPDYYVEPLSTRIFDRGCSEVNYKVYKKVKVINLPK